jgi:hypothetical protein
MSQTIHSITELRNRFSYAPASGVLTWRKVSFPEWARGNPRASFTRYENWLRTTAGRPVKPRKAVGVSVVIYRNRRYTTTRLAWALHHGKHPPEHLFVLPKNGNTQDLRAQNLELTSRSGLMTLRRARARGEVALTRDHLPDPEILEDWLKYRDGELYYQPVSLVSFKVRYCASDWSEHETWLRDHAGKPLPTRGSGRSRFQSVQFGSRWLNKAEMVFGVCRGFYPIGRVTLEPIDGDYKNCRIENLRLHFPEDFDPNEDEDDD